jgi:hypothetical protein
MLGQMNPIHIFTLNIVIHNNVILSYAPGFPKGRSP